MTKPLALLACLVSSGGLVACSFFAWPAPHKPVEFREAARRPSGERFPNWPMPPVLRVDELDFLQTHEHVVEEVEGAGAGTTGAEKLRIDFAALGEDVSFT